MEEAPGQRWGRLIAEHQAQPRETAAPEPKDRWASGSRLRLAVGAMAFAITTLLVAQVINSDVLADAKPPAGARPGAARAAARSCDSPFPGRLRAITATDHGALAIRCAYTLLGRPAFTSEIHCVDGQWTGPTGWKNWGALGVACAR